MSQENDFDEDAMMVIKAQKKRTLIITAIFVIFMIITAVMFYRAGGVNVCQKGGGYVLNKQCTGFNVLDVCEADNGDLWILGNHTENNNVNASNNTPNINTNLGVTN